MKLAFEDLKALGNKPRLHGNGFIQLNLDKNNMTRFHVWPGAQIEAQSVSTQIHDHIFEMESTILLGELEHTVYEPVFRDTGKYLLYQAEPRMEEDTELVAILGSRCDLEISQKYNFKKGDTYQFEAFKFHESLGNGLTATIMHKTAVHKDKKPRVACLVTEKPDNDFNRYSKDEELLWAEIKKVLDVIKFVEVPEGYL